MRTYEAGPRRSRLQVHAFYILFDMTNAMLTAVMVDSARYAFASQLSVLRSCPDVISRILKNGSSVLLAAKVLVISRLLHTKISQLPNPPQYLETLRTRLGSLRRRLLGRIDRRFKTLELSAEAQVEAMCAFSLATSSSPKDVLRHYHRIRLEAISEKVEHCASGYENMLLALRIYVRTLKDTRAVVPGQLAYALERLKSVSLFNSKEVYSLIELNLDIHGRWIGDDIKTFTPYIRHDDLSKAEVEVSLKQWAKKAFSAFLDGLSNRILGVQDPLLLLQLRREILELWLSNRQNSMGIDSIETLDGLRDVFNSQATRIIERRASILADVGLMVEQVLRNWQSGSSAPTPSLWELPMSSMDMANVGKAFRENLMARSIGKNEPLDAVSERYTTFLEGIEAVEEMIRNIRQTKWVDEADDVDDEEDPLDSKQVLLSEDDPRHLEEKLNDALHKAYADLQSVLTRSHAHDKDADSGPKSSFLVRIWREVRQRLPKGYQNNDLGLTSIPTLQKVILDEALRMPLERCTKRIARTSARKSLRERLLWDGNPELPMLPSAWTYQLLLDLVSSMSYYGSDLWTAQAANGLKRSLIPSIESILRWRQEAEMNGHAKSKDIDADTRVPGDEDLVNGEKDERGEQEAKNPNTEKANSALANGETSDHKENPKDERIQRLFDVLYLIDAFAVKELDNADNALISLQDSLTEDLALDGQSVERMKMNAQEYWKRTSLLFALLA